MSEAGPEPRTSVAWPVVAREWARIGLIGFGGPPAHIALLRELVVDRRGWIDAETFSDANAACSLLPGPASTQLAILCAYRLGGPAGAVAGGLGFIVPAVVLVLALSAFVLGSAPPLWVRGAAAGAGAGVAAVAVQAARGLLRPSWEQATRAPRSRLRWSSYVVAGAAGAVFLGPWLVALLLACGLAELAVQRSGARALSLAAVAPAVKTGGAAAIAWTALKVGALSFGGGFVIIPLMQGDAVHVHHWMSAQRFLDAVAFGQVTPGPVVATVAAVGYAAGGLGGGVLAAVVAFLPSFVFVLAGGRRSGHLRERGAPRSFLDGAGPAAIGAILGAAILLATALGPAWQFAVLALAVASLLIAGRGVVLTLVLAAGTGAVLAIIGLPLP